MHARKRGIESFQKLSRDGKIKRKVWVWKSKEREKNMRMKEWKKKEEKEKEKRGGSNKDMRGMNQVNEKKKIKCKEGCHVVKRRNFHSFSNHVQSDNEDVIGAS
jgi:hypothetical protein